jgi:iron complex transport system ATP-binding protein
VSFDLPPGGILALLGTNGAGKSTLLKCLNKILQPRVGTILLEQQQLRTMKREAIARKAGYVSQKSADSHMTVFETVLLGRKPHMRWSVGPQDYALVKQIIEELKLTELAHRPISDLSGGESQKAIIARALAQTPKVLLLDEPTSNLDLKNQLEITSLLRRIVKQKNLSAVVAMHDLNLALRFADELVLLKDHRVYAVVSKADLTSQLIHDIYGVEATLVHLTDQTVVVPL